MIGHIAIWLILTGLTVLAVDCAIGNFQHWHKRRKREREMARFNIAAFRGAKKSAWHL